MAARLDVKLESARPPQLRAELLVLTMRATSNTALLKEIDQLLGGRLSAELAQQRFQAKDGETAIFQTHGALPARNILVAGLGDATGPGGWYRLAQVTVSRARELGARTVAIALPPGRVSARDIELVVEGVHLSAYSFDRLKSTNSRATSPLLSVSVVVARADQDGHNAVSRGRAIAGATCYARDLVNLPAAIVTPAYLANEARRIGREQHLRVRVWDTRALQRAGMGALLGVAQGSGQPPYFLELVYQPGKTATRAKARRVTRPGGRRSVALAGKGITFDSGGLSIKPADSMQTQKRDMAGGAAVLAVMSVVRDLAIPVEVRGYVPATENMPGERAIKPGDVVRAFNGKTVEVLNTDAEGRLVLADALSYAHAAKPDLMIDLATLTAAVRMALGTRYAAIMGTNANLVRRLIAAGNECGENLWELPLVAEYRADIDSQVADIKNIGEGGAGTIIGGLFLREFVGDTPWAHIDFSSTVVTDKPFPGHPRGATGFGVRTLLRFLQSLQ